MRQIRQLALRRPTMTPVCEELANLVELDDDDGDEDAVDAEAPADAAVPPPSPDTPSDAIDGASLREPSPSRHDGAVTPTGGPIADDLDDLDAPASPVASPVGSADIPAADADDGSDDDVILVSCDCQCPQCKPLPPPPPPPPSPAPSLLCVALTQTAIPVTRPAVRQSHQQKKEHRNIRKIKAKGKGKPNRSPNLNRKASLLRLLRLHVLRRPSSLTPLRDRSAAAALAKRIQPLSQLPQNPLQLLVQRMKMQNSFRLLSLQLDSPMAVEKDNATLCSLKRLQFGSPTDVA